MTVYINVYNFGQSGSKVTAHLKALEGTIMSSLDDLKAAQDAIVALVAKVRDDVVNLTAKLEAIPPAGMTPDQQAAVDGAVTQANAIKDSLASVDSLTAAP